MCAPALSETTQSTGLSRHHSAQLRAPSSPGIATTRSRESAYDPTPQKKKLIEPF
jgi:hypothetical protein